MNIDDLIVTQHSLRNPEEIPTMIKHVAAYGLWTNAYLMHYAEEHKLRTPPLIQLSQFEDGLIYIHDGHHRIFATHKAGRKILEPEEYKVTQWTYSQYLEINLDARWTTPFDPRTHCRKADLTESREFYSFFNPIKYGDGNKDDADRLIQQSFDQYAEPRRFKHISKLEL